MKEEHLASLWRCYDAAPLEMTVWSSGYRKLLAVYYNSMIPEDASVLEAGCGNGALLELLKGREKTGIDLPPPKQIGAAR